MADENSPVVRPQRLFNGTNSGNSVTGVMVSDGSQSDHHLHSDDDELSVGGTTPPPQPLPVEEQFKEEHLDDMKVDDSVGPNLIKFSIDNILNPEFGARMNAAESAAAAVALHHHHQQLIQQHHASPATAAAAAGFLGAFHQFPFLAAARQMILAAASGGSSIDYSHHHHLAAVAAAQHAVPNSLLLPHQHSTNTLNLVQSCTDKYLGSSKPNWGSHQPALPSGVGGNRSLSQVGGGGGKGAMRAAAGAQQVTNLNNNNNKSSAVLGKAIDLSVRNSASPPDHRHHQLQQKQRLSVIGDKPSTVPLQVVSPSLASGSSNDDNSSAHSPTRSVSVGGSTCSVGNGESGSGSTGQQAGSGGEAGGGNGGKEPLWPAWVYCTRYSDRPSSGPRARRIRSKKDRKAEEKRPRTAFTSEQLARLKTEFTENRYLTEKRRQDLARELQLHENQIKIWFQNKRAKIKKASGQKNPLALQLMAQGLYNHSTMALDEDEDDDDDMLQHPE